MLLATTALFAYIDSDMDGVEDQYDKCPQTSLSDLVNDSGCTVQKMDEKLHYDLSITQEYATTNTLTQVQSDIFTTYLRSNFYIDDWRVELAGSYFTSKEKDTNTIIKGWNDTYLNLFYNFVLTQKLSIELGTGVVLPTYKSGSQNGAVDLSAHMNFSYNLNPKTYIFGGDTYTWIGDKDLIDLQYQNSNYAQLGIGTKLTSSTNVNLWYDYSESIYKDVEAIKSIGIGVRSYLNSQWFLGASYTKGFSTSQDQYSVSAELGYSY